MHICKSYCEKRVAPFCLDTVYVYVYLLCTVCVVCVWQTSGRRLGDWASHQFEVVTDKFLTESSAVWNVEEHQYALGSCLNCSSPASVSLSFSAVIFSHLPSAMSLLLCLGRGAEYCDHLVCWCLCVREHISGTAGPIFTKFCVQIPRGRGSVLLWRRCATLCTSDFMDDVTFGCNGLYGNAWKASGIAIPGRSLTFMNALFWLSHIDCFWVVLTLHCAFQMMAMMKVMYIMTEKFHLGFSANFGNCRLA